MKLRELICKLFGHKWKEEKVGGIMTNINGGLDIYPGYLVYECTRCSLHFGICKVDEYWWRNERPNKKS